MRVFSTLVVVGVTVASLGCVTLVSAAKPVVPGTGQEVPNVGDDFEDANWTYIHNGTKSSYNLDKSRREPSGYSENERWYEGIKRGHPDIVKRIPTPKNGLPGSRGALLLQSRNTGRPGRPSYITQQDDFICDIYDRLGEKIPVWQTPSCVARIFLPPVDQWENRSGAHIAFRISLDARTRFRYETYWPGMIFVFESKTESGKPHDYAYIRIRADENGNDYKAKQITTTGWWTVGMSVTPDGMVHYYAKPGTEDLTADDHIGSEFSGGWRASRFRTFFFNVLSADDGHSWSTPLIVDDPKLYVIGRQSIAGQPRRQSR